MKGFDPQTSCVDLCHNLCHKLLIKCLSKQAMFLEGSTLLGLH